VGTLLDLSGADGVGLAQGCEACLEARGVERGDAEDAMAAGGAARTAGDMHAAAPVRIFEVGVDDLDEVRVASGELRMHVFYFLPWKDG
jgi:hypothetical protein